jgi:molybdopterin biosynthesis enzyme MoaB
VRNAILAIREMDKLDGRVKMIHSRVARDVVKGGLVLQLPSENKAVSDAWHDFRRRCNLNRPDKLKSDARGLVMEGNLPMQVVINDQQRVCGIIPHANRNHRAPRR